MGKKVVLQTQSTFETIRVGKDIGTRLLPGDVIALVGELGAGKTQFVKGLAAGVGIGNSTYVSSPSFTLIHEYPGETPFYHIDLFRLGSEKEAEELGLEVYFQGSGVTAIEWANKIPSLLPKEVLVVSIAYVDENIRTLEITGRGRHYLNLVDQIQRSEVRIVNH